jgi:hypothetical protein
LNSKLKLFIVFECFIPLILRPKRSLLRLPERT